MTNREKAALDRHIESLPEDFIHDRRPDEPRARHGPDSAIATALRAEIGIAWRRMHHARRGTDFVGRNVYADVLRQDLLLLLDIWQAARRAARK